VCHGRYYDCRQRARRVSYIISTLTRGHINSAAGTRVAGYKSHKNTADANNTLVTFTYAPNENHVRAH